MDGQGENKDTETEGQRDRGTRIKFQEPNSKRQEARDKKQEARNKRQGDMRC